MSNLRTTGLLCLCFLAAAPVWAVQDVPVPAAESQACGTCHVMNNPVPGAAELKACPRPRTTAGSHKESEAPDVVYMDKLSKREEGIYAGVVFPHKLHASMTEMVGGCDTCHHRNPEGPILSCEACHGQPSNPGNLRQPGLKGAYHRQCLACHREWTHATDCGICHAKKVPGQAPPPPPDPTDIMGTLHPNIEVPDVREYKTPSLEDTPIVTFHHKEHVEAFTLKCVACHREENCSRCHDPQNHVKREREDPHQDCTKCHEKEIADNCGYCHTAEPTKGFDHGRVTGYALQPYHQPVNCRKCHPGEGRITQAASKNCSDCHVKEWQPETFDHALTGQPLDEIHMGMECAQCHPDGMGKPASCKECHDDGRKFPKPEPSEAAPAKADEPAKSKSSAEPKA